MIRKKSLMLFIHLSFFCAYPFSDGVEASSLLKRTALGEALQTKEKKTLQIYPDFISAKSDYAKKVYKNDEGFWEAEFEYGITMIYIPPGEFQTGSDTDESNVEPLRSNYLDGYWIGKYEVTFDQYDRYCEDRGIVKPDDEGWDRDRNPVINISWEDAMAYCRWLSEKIGCDFRLPTEAQWEKAARGPDGRTYPWGNSVPSDNHANFNARKAGGFKHTIPVGSYPEGSSPYGVLDMAGNVYEWCLDWYTAADMSSSGKKSTYGLKKGTYRVLRGGSWYGSSLSLETTFRTSAKPASRYFHIGFRLCME